MGASPGAHGRAVDPSFVSALLDSVPHGLVLARAPAGEVVYANRAARELLGDPVDAAGGGAASTLRTADGAPCPPDAHPFARALREKRDVVVGDLVAHRPDGRHVALRAIARPVPDAAGQVALVAVAWADVTLELRAARGAREGEERLRRAQKLEVLGRLSAGLAHDIANVLTAARLLASSLRSAAADPATAAALERIDDATAMAARMARAVLDLSRPGRAAVERVPLHVVVRSVGDLVCPAAIGRARARYGLGARTGEVLADRSQVEQIVLNLAVNARDAMGREGVVAFATRDEPADGAAGANVVLDVSDTGGGIDPGLLDRVFEPWVSSRGTGLGLATVLDIARAHGGSVEVAATGPDGTTMRVRLPAAPGA